MTIEQIYCDIADDLWDQIISDKEWHMIASSEPIDDNGHALVVWCDEDRDGKYFDITIRENYSENDWGDIISEACTQTNSFEELEEFITDMLRKFYNKTIIL